MSASGFPRAVVRDHAPAQQLGGDPPGQITVGRDQGRAGAPRLQRVAQDQRDGDRLLLLVGGGEAVQFSGIQRCRLAPGPDRRAGQQGAAEQGYAALRDDGRARPDSSVPLARFGLACPRHALHM